MTVAVKVEEVTPTATRLSGGRGFLAYRRPQRLRGSMRLSIRQLPMFVPISCPAVLSKWKWMPP
jgi:hypothetical protein